MKSERTGWVLLAIGAALFYLGFVGCVAVSFLYGTNLGEVLFQL